MCVCVTATLARSRLLPCCEASLASVALISRWTPGWASVMNSIMCDGGAAPPGEPPPPISAPVLIR